MGDSPFRLSSTFFAIGLSPAFAGLKICGALFLGLTPQALCFRLLRRLKNRLLVQSHTRLLSLKALAKYSALI